MSQAIENLNDALTYAMKNRPAVGGFPFLAETLRLAGVTRNQWHLPSCQSLFITKYGSIIRQEVPLITGTCDVAKFDREALIRALRSDQEGKSSFPEFLKASWEAGVVSYDVDFENRRVCYYGSLGESYAEAYPEVKVQR